jgi:hypothetical protein
VPVKNGTGSTQWWKDDNPTATFDGVAYKRDGNKTRTVEIAPAVEGVTCAGDVKVGDSATVGTQLNLVPSSFTKIHDTTYGTDADYFVTSFTVTIQNTASVNQNMSVMYADQQDDNKVWVERGVFSNHTNTGYDLAPGATRTFTFDVWYDEAIATAVPTGLTLDFGVIASHI